MFNTTDAQLLSPYRQSASTPQRHHTASREDDSPIVLRITNNNDDEDQRRPPQYDVISKHQEASRDVLFRTLCHLLSFALECLQQQQPRLKQHTYFRSSTSPQAVDALFHIMRWANIEASWDGALRIARRHLPFDDMRLELAPTSPSIPADVSGCTLVVPLDSVLLALIEIGEAACEPPLSVAQLTDKLTAQDGSSLLKFIESCCSPASFAARPFAGAEHLRSLSSASPAAFGADSSILMIPFTFILRSDVLDVFVAYAGKLRFLFDLLRQAKVVDPLAASGSPHQHCLLTNCVGYCAFATSSPQGSNSGIKSASSNEPPLASSQSSSAALGDDRFKQTMAYVKAYQPHLSWSHRLSFPRFCEIIALSSAIAAANSSTPTSSVQEDPSGGVRSALLMHLEDILGSAVDRITATADKARLGIERLVVGQMIHEERMKEQHLADVRRVYLYYCASLRDVSGFSPMDKAKCGRLLKDVGRQCGYSPAQLQLLACPIVPSAEGDAEVVSLEAFYQFVEQLAAWFSALTRSQQQHQEQDGSSLCEQKSLARFLRKSIPPAVYESIPIECVMHVSPDWRVMVKDVGKRYASQLAAALSQIGAAHGGQRLLRHSSSSPRSSLSTSRGVGPKEESVVTAEQVATHFAQTKLSPVIVSPGELARSIRSMFYLRTAGASDARQLLDKDLMCELFVLLATTCRALMGTNLDAALSVLFRQVVVADSSTAASGSGRR